MCVRLCVRLFGGTVARLRPVHLGQPDPKMERHQSNLPLPPPPKLCKFALALWFTVHTLPHPWSPDPPLTGGNQSGSVVARSPGVASCALTLRTNPRRCARRDPHTTTHITRAQSTQAQRKPPADPAAGPPNSRNVFLPNDAPFCHTVTLLKFPLTQHNNFAPEPRRVVRVGW